MVGFTLQDARRIAKTVKTVEDLATIQSGDVQPLAGRSTPGFWAQITDQGTGSGYKYAWTAIEPQDDGTWVQNTDWGSGTQTEGYAVSTDKSEHVLKNSKVFLHPAIGQEYFWFDYNPGIVEGTTAAIITASGNGGVTVTGQPNNITAHNVFATDVQASKTVLLAYDKDQSRWIIIGADC